VGNNRRRLLSLPSRRSCLVGCLLFAALAFIYFMLLPGTRVTDGRHDRGRNAIWMSHAWLGDASWFERNKKEALLASHRGEASIRRAADLLRDRHISDVFPHLCPATEQGKLPGLDDAQAEQFLDMFAAPEFRVMPWVGGSSESTAHVDRPAWRAAFVADCADLLRRHPRFAGVHLNIEPMRSGNADFLVLLDELRGAIGPGKILSVAAYPPPTFFHPHPDVHWEESYFRQVASRCDQLAVMLYDTALRDRRLYQNLMRAWTREVIAWAGTTQVLLGLPAYDDAGVGYHDPRVENLENALRGVHAGLMHFGALPQNYQGAALYCHWEMTDDKWRIWEQEFLHRGR